MSQPTAQTICEDLIYLIFRRTLPFLVNRNDSLVDNIIAIEPMSFSMVCHSWRAAVLSHPSLWGHIKILGLWTDPSKL